MIHYTSVAKAAEARQEINRSKFIANIKPVGSREEAEEFIRSVRARYKDASHNVPAFVIGEKQELCWASDDGEPQGTAGPPVLQMLVSEGLTNLAVVVTRYFGGIKLGTGGLVRAYSSSAKLAVEAAGIKQVRDMVRFKARVPYTALGKIQNIEKDSPFTIEDIEYADEVFLKICLQPEDENSTIAALCELLSADASGFISERQCSVE